MPHPTGVLITATNGKLVLLYCFGFGPTGILLSAVNLSRGACCVPPIPGSNPMMLAIATNQVGKVPLHVPKDEDRLRIRHAVAKVLNAKDAAEMRPGFACEWMNLRGVFTFTGGKAEREIAAGCRKMAEVLEECGYSRFATAMRELAQHFERDAGREAARSVWRLKQRRKASGYTL